MNVQQVASDALMTYGWMVFDFFSVAKVGLVVCQKPSSSSSATRLVVRSTQEENFQKVQPCQPNRVVFDMQQQR
jgi:hypothetical protein